MDHLLWGRNVERRLAPLVPGVNVDIETRFVAGVVLQRQQVCARTPGQQEGVGTDTLNTHAGAGVCVQTNADAHSATSG